MIRGTTRRYVSLEFEGTGLS